MLRLLRFTGGFTATNGYLLSLSNGEGVLVDAPDGVASWPELQKIRLQALFLTHAHFDHVLGAAQVARRFGCPIYAFTQPDPSYTLEALLAYSGMTAQVEPYQASILLTESTPLTVAGLSFRVIHVPGHSPDSLCFLPDQPLSDKAVLLGGDVLFRDSVGRTDFPHSNHEQLVTGIREKLYTLPEETVVFPGHGPSTTIGRERASNPFVRAL